VDECSINSSFDLDNTSFCSRSSSQLAVYAFHPTGRLSSAVMCYVLNYWLWCWYLILFCICRWRQCRSTAEQ